MKNLIIPILFIACLILTACNHDDEPIMDYYVRYTAIARPNAKVSMYFTKEDGQSTLIQASMPDGRFQYNVGPVRKGFKADLTVSYDEGGPVDYLSLEVSQGTTPFVLKKHGTKTFDLMYTIE